VLDVSYKPFALSLPNRARREAAPHLVSWRLGGIAIVRIAFGCIWAIDAWFKWQREFVDNFTGYLTKALNGQPSAIAIWINFWIHVVSVNPHLFAFLVAMGETGIALGLLFGAFSNLTCLIGILLSLSIWSTAHGFGGPYGPGSTDIGVSIIYLLVFIGLFLGNAGLTFGVDRYVANALGRTIN
jgi:nitrite reductase (NO-forming)